MENPFSTDKNPPFLTPYQAGSENSEAQAIKPFAAVDLAPKVGAASPAGGFAGGDFGSAFLARDPAPARPSKTPATPPAPVSEILILSEDPEPEADFIAVANTVGPVAAQAEARSLSIADFDTALGLKKPAFFCTTTSTVDGFAISGYLGVVSVEIVIPKDILFQNPAPYGELHRIKAAEEQLQRIRETAMRELSEKARKMGADAVVGLTLLFSPFDAIVCLCSAVGTAVKLSG